MRSLIPAIFCLSTALSHAQVTVAHLSDLHLDLSTAPGTEDRLRQAVDIINARNVDAVIVTGDIGEQFEDSWRKAREILRRSKAPVYFVPGNHDDSYSSIERFSADFGHSYYVFCVRDVTFLALDSQMLGNFDEFNSKQVQHVPSEYKRVPEEELHWLEQLPADFSCVPGRDNKTPGGGRTVIAVQHVPPDRAAETSPDDRPYWILHDPYRTRELDALRRLGVKHIFAGHWHKGVTYAKDGFNYHVAPATSWSPASPLGFALEKISAEGDVATEFVYLPQTK